MAFIKTTAGRNACNDTGFAVACNGGSVKVYASNHTTLLATFTLSNPAFGSSSNGAVAMAGGAKTATPASNGTAAIYDICKSDATVLGSGTVATSGGDMTLSNLNLVTTNDVSLNSYTHTEPAS